MAGRVAMKEGAHHGADALACSKKAHEGAVDVEDVLGEDGHQGHVGEEGQVEQSR